MKNSSRVKLTVLFIVIMNSLILINFFNKKKETNHLPERIYSSENTTIKADTIHNFDGSYFLVMQGKNGKSLSIDSKIKDVFNKGALVGYLVVNTKYYDLNMNNIYDHGDRLVPPVDQRFFALK